MLKRCDWFQKLALLATELYFRFYYRLKFYGIQNVPVAGCIVCANHSSYADPVLLAIAAGKGKAKISIMAKKELFKKLVFRVLIQSLGAFPVERGKADVNAIKTTFKSLESGDKFIIFPEGTRVKEGEKPDIKPGAGMFALRTKKPVLPVYITSNKKFGSRVSVIVGQPFFPETKGEKGTESYMNASEEILQKIYAMRENEHGN